MAIKGLIGSHKGGVGKTQTTLELAWYLATNGKKVLAVDLDHQAHLTYHLSAGVQFPGRTIADILIEGDAIAPTDIRHRSIDKKGHVIDFIPASLALGRLEKKLSDETPKEYVLQDALTTVQEQYDFIVIDAPPSAELIGTAALVAADYVVIPSTPTTLGILGVEEYMPMIKTMQAQPRMNPDLKILGILITMYDLTKDSKKAVTKLKNEYGDLVVEPYIRRRVGVRNSNDEYKSIQAYDPNCDSARDYVRAFEVLLGRIA